MIVFYENIIVPGAAGFISQNNEYNQKIFIRLLKESTQRLTRFLLSLFKKFYLSKLII